MKANQPLLAHFLFLLCLAVVSHAVPAQEPATVEKSPTSLVSQKT